MTGCVMAAWFLDDVENSRTGTKKLLQLIRGGSKNSLTPFELPFCDAVLPMTACRLLWSCEDLVGKTEPPGSKDCSP